MPSAGDSSSRPGHSRVRSASIPLDTALIATAVASSTDGGKTLDFSQKHIGDVGEEAAEELAHVGTDELDDEGIVTRLALSNNYLRKLPPNFASLYRLRYLNLRANAFVTFPDVVTKMPSLEILDIGRNKIQLLPAEPGTLVNLRVFSLSKNRITRLPAYFVDFRNLKMLKVDNNPIEWPPASVVQDRIPPTDKTEDMIQFITQLKQWYIANVSPRKSSAEQSRRAPSSQPNKVGKSRATFGRAAHGRNVSEDSVNSEYSVTSEYSLVDNVNYVAGNTGALNISKKTRPSVSESGGSPDTSVPALEETIPSSSASYHGRNASYSVDTRRPTGSVGNLTSKQSLPDLRNGYNPNGTIKASGRKAREPLAGHFSSRQNGASSSAAAGITSPPLPMTHSIHQGEISPPFPGSSPETPMDGVRNSYFRRLSTIPLSVSAPPLPQSLVQTVDAIRGILFAVSQIYSAIQQYTNVIVERRIADILVRILLNPGKRAMDTLISALERYDSTAQRAVPNALQCRAVVEACHENVSACFRVVSVLRVQLKVLATGAGGDVRFARHLLLVLYGGVAEVVNSWRDLMPHLAEVKEYLAETAVSPLPLPATSISKSGLGLSMGPSTSGPSSSRRPISPIEEHTEPLNTTIARASESELESAPTSARSAPQPNHSRDLKLSTAGRILSPSPMDSPMSAGSDAPVAQSSPTPLRSALKNSSANGLHADRSTPSSPNHSISGRTASRERNLPDITGSPLMRTNGRPARRGPGTLLAPSDSLQGVDEDLLNTAEKAAAIASEMWALLGATIDSARSQGVGKAVIAPIDEGLSNALDATSKLRAALRAAREGAGKEAAGRRPLYEFATLFAKSVTRAIVLLKNFANSYPISLPLRGAAQRVTQATQETIFFLQASSFAPPPSARPTTPAFAVGLGLGVADTGDAHSRAGASLFRNRSAAVGVTPSASSGPTPIPGTPREVPWSAMPGQSFKSDEPMTAPTSLIGRTGAQMI